MAYTGQDPWGRSTTGINSSRLYRQNKKGYQPEGPWWQKLLATVIAVIVFILFLAIISGGEVFKIIADIL